MVQLYGYMVNDEEFVAELREIMKDNEYLPQEFKVIATTEAFVGVVTSVENYKEMLENIFNLFHIDIDGEAEYYEFDKQDNYVITDSGYKGDWVRI